MKKVTRVWSETSYDPSELPARVDRRQEQMKKGIVFVKYLNQRYFQITCTLSFIDCYSLGLDQKFRSKMSQQFQLGTRTKTLQVKF